MLNAFLNVTRPLPSALIALLCAVLWKHFGLIGLRLDPVSINTTVTGMNVLAQVAVTMLGFMMAVLAILASIANTKLIRNMQRSGHFHNMLTRIFACSLSFAAVTLAALVASFRPDQLDILASAVAAFTMMAILLFASSLAMLWQTLVHLRPTTKEIE
jgi:hypothetical protein